MCHKQNDSFVLSRLKASINRNLEGYPRIEVGRHNSNNLRYTDDTVLSDLEHDQYNNLPNGRSLLREAPR